MSRNRKIVFYAVTNVSGIVVWSSQQDMFSDRRIWWMMLLLDVALLNGLALIVNHYLKSYRGGGPRT